VSGDEADLTAIRRLQDVLKGRLSRISEGGHAKPPHE
jgi:hypothetical protein